MFESKHEKKVNECYPVGTGEIGPSAGKISALTYYINAKPVKLLKVSSYLEKKVPRDLHKQGAAYNAVTLDIIEGIMVNCSEYFSTFAPTVLRLLILFNDSPFSNALRAPINNSFVECCKLVKTVLPSIRDAEFFNTLTVALDKMLRNESNARDIDDQGLLASNIQAVVTMEDFKGPKGEERIAIILRAIIKFFGSQGTTHLDISRLLQRPSGQQPEPSQIIGYSYVCLIEGGNSTTVPIILRTLFREFDRHEWTLQRLCGGMLSILVHSIPAQYLCVVLSEIFRKLEETEDNVTTVLADTIAELLRSNRSPLGYSGLELARNLLKLLRKQRPDATEGLRVSIIKVRPPRTIYAICNAFVALLRNANFALQKYEIIESIIARSFFRDSPPSAPSGMSESTARLSIPTTMHDRHSLFTVSLDRSEEMHFNSVVWGILFALAEEGSSPSVLRLAFVDVHVKLFETIFRMIRVGDEEFVLNTLVFWRQLLLHGLPIVPTRRSDTSPLPILSGSSNGRSAGTTAIGKASMLIFSNARLVLGYLANSKDLTITLVHVTAILTLISAMLGDCDISQLGIFSSFLYWSYQRYFEVLTLMEDRACVVLFCLTLFKEIGGQLGKYSKDREKPSPLAALSSNAIDEMHRRGMPVVDMEEILDASRPLFSLFCGNSDLDASKLMPGEAEIMTAFSESLPVDFSLEVRPYSLQVDHDFVAAGGNQKISDRVSYQRGTISTTSPTHPPPPEAGGNNFMKLAKYRRGGPMGSKATSAITAPAFYQLEVPSNQPARALTVSSTSLAHSEAQSIITTVSVGNSVSDPLDGKFEQLSVKMKEKRQKDKTASLIFFKK